MKTALVVVAALLGSASAKECDAIEISVFSDDQCANADTTLAEAATGLATGYKTLAGQSKGECKEAPAAYKAAFAYSKLDCTATKMTGGIFSDDKCATAKVISAGNPVSALVAAGAGGIEKDKCIAHKLGDSEKDVFVKFSFKEKEAAADGSHANMGISAAMVASTLAVAASLY